MPDPAPLAGLVVRAQSGFFEVETEEGRVLAKIRGRLTEGARTTDRIALGDRVHVRVLEDGGGIIDSVEPRQRVLSRRDPSRPVEQILVANPDQAVFVLACADPDPNFRLLDRLLVVAERERLPVVVCANKIDLVYARSARAEFGEYQRLGYEVHYVSAKTGKGLRRFRKALGKRLSVFAGPSGVGKSTLLNALEPGLRLPTHAVRQQTRKGMHTTVHLELLPLTGGGYVADTPGVKAFALWDIEPEELDAYFREMRDLVADCHFSDCTHTHEPGCAVIAAVERGWISPERYDSYQRIRSGEPD